MGIIQKVKHYQIIFVINKKKKNSGYNMKNEMLLSVLCYYYFFSGYNIKSEILLSIVCDLKKKF